MSGHKLFTVAYCVGKFLLTTWLRCDENHCMIQRRYWQHSYEIKSPFWPLTSTSCKCVLRSHTFGGLGSDFLGEFTWVHCIIPWGGVLRKLRFPVHRREYARWWDGGPYAARKKNVRCWPWWATFEGMQTDSSSTACSELPLVALCAPDCLLNRVCMGTCTWVSLLRRGFLGSSVSSSTGGIVLDIGSLFSQI